MSTWTKHPENPVLGPGICIKAVFDCCVLPQGNKLRMWFSWRALASIAYTESTDGVHWTGPRVVLEVNQHIEWEKDCVNRVQVLKVGDKWYMWYTGQNRTTKKCGAIGLATSHDGEHWERLGSKPVFGPEAAWEKNSLICPHVLFEHGKFRMWYSGGEMYEPDAVGYAESKDGIHWQREAANPVLRPAGGWESDRVTAACIVPRAKDYVAFCIGFAQGFEKCQIGIARSKDGVHDWERYPSNPVITPGPAGSWDDCNVYKPYAVRFHDKWYVWYNASRFSDRREQIGLATVDDIDF